MAHLTDLEELLATIPGSEIRDYMREAMNCYMAGAYRGSIVLSYIALFDDLLAKLGELASVNSEAKTIHTNAQQKRSDQEVYESYLIDQLTAQNFITGLDNAFLTTLRTLRNKSAHPSGHTPSAEEARFIFHETVSRFLSKPLLSTTHLVDQLIARLKNANFFPSAALVEIEAIVADETKTLHDQAMPQLVAKLIGAVASTDATTQTNACYFLIGLAKLNKPAPSAALQSKLIALKADDSGFADLITQCLSANGHLVVGLNVTAVNRVRALLTAKIADTKASVAESKLIHPTSALASIAAAVPDSELLSTYKPELEALFAKRSHSPFVAKLVQERPALLPLYLPHLLAKAGSATFNEANAFANSLDSLDPLLGKLLSDEQALHLVVAVVKAAGWGAWSAKGVVSAKFSDGPSLRAKASSYIEANKGEAEAYVNEQLSGVMSADEFVTTHLADEAEA
jgi:hypothetical protein